MNELEFRRLYWRYWADYAIGLNDAIEELRMQDNPVANNLLGAYQSTKTQFEQRNVEHLILEVTNRSHLIAGIENIKGSKQ